MTNYKSIASCDVSLGPLTILVGPNAAGKSNFLDSLNFLSEALATTPSQAIEARGGVPDLLIQGPGPKRFSIWIEAKMPGPKPDHARVEGEYGFTIGPSRGLRRPWAVVHEEYALRWPDRTEHFRVEHGEVVEDSSPEFRGSRIEPDRLYLQTAGARPSVAPLFESLAGMRFYNLDPATLRLPQPQTRGAALGRRGEHLGDVLGALAQDHQWTKERLDSYISVVAPRVEGVDRRKAGSYSAVEMRQRSGDGTEVTFGADGMSDGTIRAVGVLAALFQPSVLDGQTSLVGVEEPEVALHPSATGVLYDALTEASERVQVLVTTQSTDLIDRDDLDPSSLRAVADEGGRTVIGPVDEVSLEALRKRQLTAGELLRAGQLNPEMPTTNDSPRTGG